MKSLVAFLFPLFALLSCNAFAGSISVSPVQVLSRGTPHIAVITFGNQGDKPTRYQIEVEAWTQKDGKNVYTPTHDILISPPLLELPAHTNRIVRVFPTHPLTGSQYYILFFRQLDSVMSVQEQGHIISYLVNQKLKAAYEPADAAPAALTAHAVDGHLELSNGGGLHASIVSIGQPGKKPALAGALGWVLPGSSLRFDRAPAHVGDTVAIGLQDGTTIDLTVQ